MTNTTAGKISSSAVFSQAGFSVGEILTPEEIRARGTYVITRRTNNGQGIVIYDTTKNEIVATGTLADRNNPDLPYVIDEKTSSGNIIRRGFSWAGCNGSEYALEEKKSKAGFEDFYNCAPYKWAKVHIKNMQIFTYTEGDTALIICDDKEHFIAELNSFLAFEKQTDEGNDYGIQKTLDKVLTTTGKGE